ncbi:hypothetical protein [Phytohabitans aurantiacus]|uniref:Toprim domain-containing protein n=1 Tax=Phytohabitans aurantiacus TaxID=3016789 RepID=A0ABQ5R1K6_9ACTN|nr:hypothetical protein [Phytohabitans aurantiacus]GLI00684.1 hypothetical protein Pa4123_59600 [Phytohabitans aurantiacus]
MIVYAYTQLDGREVFQRVRFEDPVYENGVLLGYTKTIVYRHQCIRPCGWIDWRGQRWWADPDVPEAWHWEKPVGADGYVYRLPEIAEASTLYITEGEKDADAMVTAGVVATTHHQGAEVGPSRLQARRVIAADVGRVVIVADRDEAGAYCAWKWHELLRTTPPTGDRLIGEGMSADRITIVRARGPLAKVKDAADHLAAGYGPEDFVPVEKTEVQRVAIQHRAGRRGRARRAYRPGRRWGGR